MIAAYHRYRLRTTVAKSFGPDDSQLAGSTCTFVHRKPHPANPKAVDKEKDVKIIS